MMLIFISPQSPANSCRFLLVMNPQYNAETAFGTGQIEPPKARGICYRPQEIVNQTLYCAYTAMAPETLRDTVGRHAETRADMQGWRPEMQKKGGLVCGRCLGSAVRDAKKGSLACGGCLGLAVRDAKTGGREKER